MVVRWWMLVQSGQTWQRNYEGAKRCSRSDRKLVNILFCSRTNERMSPRKTKLPWQRFLCHRYKTPRRSLHSLHWSLSIAVSCSTIEFSSTFWNFSSQSSACEQEEHLIFL
jgi:hypothetical protein